MTHYDTLEVSPSASPEVIRAAYKSLIQRFHPDRHPGDEAIAERAAAIAQAYDVLSDPARRAAYSESLRQHSALRPPERRLQPVRSGAAPASRINWWWLLFLVAAAGVVWGVASLSGNRNDPRAELASMRQQFASGAATEAQKRALYLRKQDILEQHPELLRAVSAERTQDLATRTFDLLEAPLVVQVGGDTAGATGPSAELTIQRVSLLVGSFDAPALLAHIARHRARLVQDVSARLARQDPARLARPQADVHLKRLVQDAVSASLGADPGQDYPSTWFESPGRHGVVDVLLPESFGLVQLSSLR